MLERPETSSAEPEIPEAVLYSLKDAFDTHQYADWAAAGLKSGLVRAAAFYHLPSKQQKDAWEADHGEKLYITDRNLSEIELPEPKDS